jgi:hypothetical protein
MATSGIASRPIAGISITTKGVKLLQNYFYFSMSLLIAAVVTYGFSHTVNGRWSWCEEEVRMEVARPRYT